MSTKRLTSRFDVTAIPTIFVGGGATLVEKNIDKRTKCYYAHPYSAWERGSNEVANKLIRRFVPKGTDIGKLKRKDILRIQHWMNNYPRRIFGYFTANEIYAT